MSVSPAQRRAERPRWRRLTQLAISATAEPSDRRRSLDLGINSRGSNAWILPSPERDEGLAVAAFAACAQAFGAQASLKGREQLAPALKILAVLAGDILDATDAAAASDAPAYWIDRD